MSGVGAADVERVFRAESGRAVASLIRHLGDIDLAEEAVAGAFAIAAERWPTVGVPPNPAIRSPPTIPSCPRVMRSISERVQPRHRYRARGSTRRRGAARPPARTNHRLTTRAVAVPEP